MNIYEDNKALRLFLLDVGLLVILIGVTQEMLLAENGLFQKITRKRSHF